jgi:hypothetical protein
MHTVSCSQFYEVKRAFQQHGLEGLVDKPPVPGSHPSRLSKKTTSRIIALSLEHPAFGQPRIADQLALEGVAVCSCIRSLLAGAIRRSDPLGWPPSQRGLDGSDNCPASDPTPIGLPLRSSGAFQIAE